MKSDWSRKFDDPIPLLNGRQLVTLKDAGTYITKLPAAEHEAQEWQAAMEALILVATAGGPTMFARIGRPTRLTPAVRLPNSRNVASMSLSPKERLAGSRRTRANGD